MPLSAVHDSTSEEFFRWGEGDRSHPPATRVGRHGVTDSPRAGHEGALQGLDLWPTQRGGAKRRGAASRSPPLTGASSGTPGNPARRAGAPRRRQHGRACTEVKTASSLLAAVRAQAGGL